jgi:hypothetical protein
MENLTMMMIILMMAQVENSGIIRAPRAAFKKQVNLADLVNYFDAVTAAMLLNPSYAGITTKITAARGKIKDCHDAIVAQEQGTGTAKQKNMASYLMQNDMNTLLADIQVVGNNDIPNAVINYEKVDCIYRSRKSHERDELEVYHGDISGSLDMQIRVPEGNFSVVFFYTTDPSKEENWKFGDWNHNTSGHLDGLTKGVNYYIRARYKSTITGKSDWTPVVNIMCL